MLDDSIVMRFVSSLSWTNLWAETVIVPGFRPDREFSD
jgi:hypothetical protein